MNSTNTSGPGKGLVARFGERFGVDPGKVMNTLKQTAFRVKNGQVSDEQMMALLIVADQHRLNPFTKEIYAFPDKQNGIIPIVSVDGWNRIINEHPQMDGIEFRYSEERMTPQDSDLSGFEWIECVIHRKDRKHPIVVREYLEEVYRPAFVTNDGKKIKGPWQTHIKRFHRHKAEIQGARIAFGFAGIYDEDEAERIIEAQEARAGSRRGRTYDSEVQQDAPEPHREPQRQQLPFMDDSEFNLTLDVWRKAVETGKKTPDEILVMAQTRNDLTAEQRERIAALGEPAPFDDNNFDPDGPIPGLDEPETQGDTA